MQSFTQGPRVASQTPWISRTRLANLWNVTPLSTQRRVRLTARLVAPPMAISSFVDGVKKAFGQVSYTDL